MFRAKTFHVQVCWLDRLSVLKRMDQLWRTETMVPSTDKLTFEVRSYGDSGTLEAFVDDFTLRKLYGKLRIRRYQLHTRRHIDRN